MPQNPHTFRPPERAKPRVLVIAPHGSYRTAAFIKAAHKLGIQVLIASEGQHSIVSEYAQGLHLDPRETSSLDLILDEAGQTGFAGVIGTDDATLPLATAVARALDLPHNEPAAVKLTQRKDLARHCLAQSCVTVPGHRCIDLYQNESLKTDADLLWAYMSQIEGLDFPVVIKPLALSASRGVIRANNPQEMLRACERVRHMLACEPHLDEETRHRLLVEEYIPGAEVAVEAMLYQGELEILTVFDKPDAMEGPFFEETCYITPSRHKAQTLQRLQLLIEQTCHAYGLKEGPVHAECRINNEGVWILEVAARTIGGLCGRLLKFGTGYSLEELVLAHAMGQRLDYRQTNEAAGVMMIPIPKAGVFKRVEGLLAAQRVEFIDDIDIQIRQGYELTPLPEGASYLGFIFARAAEPQQVETALKEAHRLLDIVIDPLLKIKVA